MKADAASYCPGNLAKKFRSVSACAQAPVCLRREVRVHTDKGTTGGIANKMPIVRHNTHGRDHSAIQSRRGVATGVSSAFRLSREEETCHGLSTIPNDERSSRVRRCQNLKIKSCSEEGLNTSRMRAYCIHLPQKGRRHPKSTCRLPMTGSELAPTVFDANPTAKPATHDSLIPTTTRICSSPKTVDTSLAEIPSNRHSCRRICWPLKGPWWHTVTTYAGIME